ncbi:MAG: adenosylcobinamide-phosphate synthase [Rhodobacterales bacterium]|nr:MAG: adenosylcobinamide-phosphate synthase [Rhodobacterales bacterium]
MTLFLALLLDAALGEPRLLWDRVPHPAVVMGRAVAWMDARLNHGPSRRVRGIVALVLLLLGAGGIGHALACLGWPVEVVVAAILLAQRSLVEHVRAVARGLRLSLGEGRRAVAMIVGRDTGQMDEAAVARGAIESAAENFSDGVVAPAFWFLLGGLPGLLIYKITNTADSMIGYRTEKYEQFGWAAARFDDLLNLVPARLSAILLAVTHGVGHWREIAVDARKHRSPNAGWPEAAMARGLGVALAGPRSYDGKLKEFPFVNGSGTRNIGASEIEAACAALWRGWAGLLGVALLFWLSGLG